MQVRWRSAYWKLLRIARAQDLHSSTRPRRHLVDPKLGNQMKGIKRIIQW